MVARSPGTRKWPPPEAVKLAMGTESRSWLGAKIIQSPDEQDHRIERAGNGGVDRVGEMQFSPDVVAVDFGVEGMLAPRPRSH